GLEPSQALLIDQGRLDGELSLRGAALSELITMGSKGLLRALELAHHVIGALAGERRPEVRFLAPVGELTHAGRYLEDPLLEGGELLVRSGLRLTQRTLTPQRLDLGLPRLL